VAFSTAGAEMIEKSVVVKACPVSIARAHWKISEGPKRLHPSRPESRKSGAAPKTLELLKFARSKK